MPECPNDCDGQRFSQTVTQAKRVIVNERGEVITCQRVGEPTISNVHCAGCGTKVAGDKKAEEPEDFDPKAWRFRKNSAWELQQQFPEEIDLDEVESYQQFQHPRGTVEDEEPLYSETQLGKAYQLGKKAGEQSEGENQ